MMGRVAELYGLELEEEFKIANSGYIYKFTDQGLMVKTGDEWYTSPKTLQQMLTGEKEPQVYEPIQNGEKNFDKLLESMEGIVEMLEGDINYLGSIGEEKLQKLATNVKSEIDDALEEHRYNR